MCVVTVTISFVPRLRAGLVHTDCACVHFYNYTNIPDKSVNFHFTDLLRYSDPTGRQADPENEDVPPQEDLGETITVFARLPQYSPPRGFFRLPFSTLPSSPRGGIPRPATELGADDLPGPNRESDEPEAEDEEEDDPCATQIRPSINIGGGLGILGGAAGSVAFWGPNTPMVASWIYGAGITWPLPELGAGIGLSISSGVLSEGTGIFLSGNLPLTPIIGPGGNLEAIRGSNGAWSFSVHLGIGTPHAGVFLGNTESRTFLKGEELQPTPCE